ncbi:hypothetical protein [Pedobacter sp. W3I1]|uniref:hypothetical protein n=1 Tax=Pedobacter sp. W3I1 TaxID=3042291 RepID=UPI0027D8A2FB|nr:hypothetical protein [Pedobacter sp. W3I1]
MKSAKSTALGFLLITSFSCLSIGVLAQNKQTKPDIFENIDRLNGNDVIERLAAQRSAFNKIVQKTTFQKQNTSSTGIT